MNNINIVKRNGKKVPLDVLKIRKTLEKANEGIIGTDILEVERDSHLIFRDGMTTKEIQRTLKQCVNDKIKVETPNYTYLGARLELQDLVKEAGKYSKYRSLSEVITKGVEQGIYINELATQYNLNLLNDYIDVEKDKLLTYYGVVTFRDRYAKYNLDGTLLELPQHLFMRVAMAVAIKDEAKGWLSDELISEIRNKEPMLSDEAVYRHCWTIEFYRGLSALEFLGSTPILGNAGTPYGMLIACFVGTTGDTLESRTRSSHNFAICSSFGGGIGDDITDLRANGGRLRNFKKGANGIIPHIKTEHGNTMQYNQAGTRNGSHAFSIVPYHLDLFDFIELKKQSGEENRRTKGKGIYPELFFPDIFFERLLSGGKWTLFDPQDVPDLNTVWGKEFSELYEKYENTKGINKREYDAYEVFKKVVMELDATGSPFVLYRDNFNRRNTQAHDGIIKSSQLCVTGDTKLLTKQGNIPISDLEGKEVECWNGVEWSLTPIFKTSEGQKVFKVLFNNETEQRATPYHRWLVKTGRDKVEIKRTHELKPNDKLVKFDLALIEHGDNRLPLAYVNGFHTGDGTEYDNTCRISLYSDVKKSIVDKKLIGYRNISWDNAGRVNLFYKRDSLKPKFFIPSSNYVLQDRLEWFEGLLDSDGTLTYNYDNGAYGLQIASVNKEFLREVRLFLQELGVHSNLKLMRGSGNSYLPKNNGNGEYAYYQTQPLYRLTIANNGVYKLKALGLNPCRIDLASVNIKLSENSRLTYVKVIQVLDEGEILPTYCGTEPRLNRLVFNGVLQMNCTEIGVVAKPSYFKGWELDADGNSIEKWELGKTNICCLASQNLARLKTIKDIERSTKLAIRFLDNVVTINKYVTPETFKAGMEDRNIGLGTMGEMEAIASKGYYFGSEEHKAYINETYQAIDYYATEASILLAKERGTYKTYEGSSWSNGIFTAELGTNIKLEDTEQFKWDSYLRPLMKENGMRNANLTATAPTGTISTFAGTTPCIEPTYKRRYLEESRDGDYIAVTAPNISVNNYQQYQPAEEIDQKLVLRMAKERQTWITQAQSLNIFKPLSGDFDELMELYVLAWKLGLKSTYYLKNRSKLSANFDSAKENLIACAGCD